MANKKIYRFIALGAAVLALLALIMAFIPTVSVKVMGETKKYNSFAVSFGSVIMTNSGAVTKFAFNALGFLALVLFVPGFVLAIVAAAKSEGKKAISIVSAVFLILSGILMFCLLGTAKITTTAGSFSQTLKIDDKEFGDAIKKLSGSVLYGVVAILSGAASIVSAAFNKN